MLVSTEITASSARHNAAVLAKSPMREPKCVMFFFRLLRIVHGLKRLAEDCTNYILSLGFQLLSLIPCFFVGHSGCWGFLPTNTDPFF